MKPTEMIQNFESIPTVAQVEARLGKRSFYEFLKIVWKEISSDEFVDGWHIKLLCDYLQATYEGKVRNLILNIPSRHAKSTIVSTFPAWVWVNKPYKTFLFSSYSESVASDSSIRFRKLVTSETYQARWPLKIKAQQDVYISNDRNGFLRAVGAGGSITGRGGDWIISDDPINSEDVNSETTRKKINLWYQNTWSNRVKNPKTAVRILIQQRLHEDDTTAMILEGQLKYEHVCLPAEYDGTRYVSSIGMDDPRTEIGEPLWSERYGKKELEEAKQSYTETGYSAQFQQRPVPLSGFVFKKTWFINRVNNIDIKYRFLSLDTASVDSKTSDYTACVCGEITSKHQLFIRDVVREKLEFPQLVDFAKKMAKKYSYKLQNIVIENKGSGIQLIQTLQQGSDKELASLIYPFNPGRAEKSERGVLASLWCSNDSVLLPPLTEGYEFLFDFENELFSFPNVRHDDCVDAFDMLILYLENYLSDGFRYRQNRSKN
jgi:predicted phage terminase large subunit-like protein